MSFAFHENGVTTNGILGEQTLRFLGEVAIRDSLRNNAHLMEEHGMRAASLLFILLYSVPAAAQILNPIALADDSKGKDQLVRSGSFEGRHAKIRPNFRELWFAPAKSTRMMPSGNH